MCEEKLEKKKKERKREMEEEEKRCIRVNKFFFLCRDVNRCNALAYVILRCSVVRVIARDARARVFLRYV